MNLRKILSITTALGLTAGLSLVACTPAPTPTPQAIIQTVEVPVVETVEVLVTPVGEPTQPPGEGEIGAGKRVAVVFASSGLGDKSFNDSLFAGAVMATERFGNTWDYVEPSAESDYEPFLRSYAQSGEYELIISNGFSQGSSLGAVAPDFPDQNFMIIDAVVEVPNVASYVYKSEEAAYLAGIVAGLYTQRTDHPLINAENKLGFVGGMDIPLIEAFAAGFKAGALSVNPEVEVLVSYVGAWDDPAGARELATAQFQQGADIVYQVASLGGLGVIEGAREEGFLAIGQDANQNYLAPDNMLLSVLKRIDNTAVLAIHDVFAGTWTPGLHNLGLAEGGVDITNELSNVTIGDDIWAEVDAARESIIDGSLVVPTSLAELET